MGLTHWTKNVRRWANGGLAALMQPTSLIAGWWLYRVFGPDGTVLVTGYAKSGSRAQAEADSVLHHTRKTG
jgi:hypothetical protein